MRASPGADFNVATVEFTNLYSNDCTLNVSFRAQARIAGRWQNPETLPQVVRPIDTDRETVTFAFPSHAQDCRFLVGYTTYSKHGRLYYNAYDYLEKHGLRSRFPRLSDLILTGLKEKERQVTVDLPLSSFQSRQSGDLARD